MTIPPLILWVAALLTVLAAASPVSRERLDRFAAQTGFTVTAADAEQVVGHFRAVRRWRLIALVVAVPVAGLTNDPFSLVLGWCAVSVVFSRGASNAYDEARVYRGAWLLGLAGAVSATAFLLRDVTAARIAHTGILIAVAVAVTFAARREAASAPAELAIGRWSTRGLYLAGTAIVLSAALLTPGLPVLPEPPAYTPPLTFSDSRPSFETVRTYKAPSCAWTTQVAADCRGWLVNGQPFPQAAPYVVVPGKAPRPAPFTRSPDKRALVYLHRHDRRLVYEDEAGARPLTGALADTELPKVTFAGQNRYLALVRDGARIIDTRTWRTLELPDVRRVHDLGKSGIVAATAARALVLDHQGKPRMSLPAGDAYHLHPKGHRLVVIDDEGRVTTYDVKTGERLRTVTPVFRGDDSLGSGLGWSAKGAFQVRAAWSERVYNLDLSTGKLWR
ncbi:hypothetical protein [Nonomuraea ceibae]|uniref:hypothetical protein n=1 Tax=Nonomuraea ceibae TaxID=1935170 RepID=UPI001C5FD849|nr:hypothetical protein [Nonomuraea ceibae]